MLNRLTPILLAFALSAPLLSHAGVVDQGDGTVLDDQSGLLWLKDWNMAGPQTRPDAIDWAAGLTVAGLTGWRLPTLDELLDLGAQMRAEVVDDDYFGLILHFDNVVENLYWSSSDSYGSYPTPTDGIGFAYNVDGAWGYHGTHESLFTVAVFGGEPTATTVPEPNALLLAGAALGLLGLRSRKG